MGVEIPMSLHDNGDPRMLQIRDAQLQHICVGQTYFSVILCMQVDVTLYVACCDKSADPFGLTHPLSIGRSRNLLVELTDTHPIPSVGGQYPPGLAFAGTRGAFDEEGSL
jgi:hypothetical protein